MSGHPDVADRAADPHSYSGSDWKLMRTHRALADLTVAAYGHPPAIDVGGDVRCVIVADPDETIIVCPGTVSLEGWMRDFSAWPKSYGALGYLHEGFGDGGMKLWTRLVLRHIESPMLTLCGHSLGAAVAQNLAAWAALAGYRFRVVTWGTPRQCVFWNWSFTKLIGQAAQAVSYVNIDDVVCDTPFRPLWKHTLKRTNLPGRSLGNVHADHSMALYATRTPAVGG